MAAAAMATSGAPRPASSSSASSPSVPSPPEGLSAGALEAAAAAWLRRRLQAARRRRFCFKIPDGYPLAKAGPLLCAGITVYTPMIRHNMNQPGKSLGVIGLGGLGHMAVKFGKAFGLKVTVFSTSESKRAQAIDLLGADNFVISSDKQQMEALKGSLHFIIDTADHPFDPYLSLLKAGGTMTLVGFPSEINMHPGSLIFGARTLSGSGGGGTKGIQEMLNFCAANKIYPEVEVIKMDYINEALKRLVNRDVKYCFVIDIENSLN